MNALRRSNNRLFFLGVLLVLSAGCSNASNPEDVARRALHAIQADDAEALTALAPRRVQRNVEESPQQAQKELARAFEQWRWAKPLGMEVQSWDGNLRGVRYFEPEGILYSGPRAQVKFDDLSDEEIAVVSLVWEQGGWCFVDLHSPTPEMWERGATTVPWPDEP
ncbi:MAG: hypothetical protein RIC55_05365 [Pirellulaceae bacterium]